MFICGFALGMSLGFHAGSSTAGLLLVLRLGPLEQLGFPMLYLLFTKLVLL